MKKIILTVLLLAAIAGGTVFYFKGEEVRQFSRDKEKIEKMLEAQDLEGAKKYANENIVKIKREEFPLRFAYLFSTVAWADFLNLKKSTQFPEPYLALRFLEETKMRFLESLRLLRKSKFKEEAFVLIPIVEYKIGEMEKFEKENLKSAKKEEQKVKTEVGIANKKPAAPYNPFKAKKK